METFVTIQAALDQPGMKQYFQKKGGEQFLETISKEMCCFIRLHSEDTDQWISARNDAVNCFYYFMMFFDQNSFYGKIIQRIRD